jgi:hypothetical protein
MTSGDPGDNVGQGGLAAPRGSPEDERGKEPVGLNGPSQEVSRTDKMILTEELC